MHICTVKTIPFLRYEEKTRKKRNYVIFKDKSINNYTNEKKTGACREPSIDVVVNRDINQITLSSCIICVPKTSMRLPNAWNFFLLCTVLLLILMP